MKEEKTNMIKKGIIGYGGFGREVFHSLTKKEQEDIIFFVHDEWWKPGNDKVIPLSKFNPNEYEVVVAIGDPSDKKKVVESLPKETRFFTHIHNSATILDDSIEIGEGTIICAGVILTTNIKVGKHVHLNLLTTIGHDTVIGDFTTTAPGSKISGNCNIGECVYLGTNSSVKQKINICDNTIVGLNAGIVRNIDEPGVYVGVPAKKK